MNDQYYSALHPGFSVAMAASDEAELRLYGEIVERRPVDFRTDEPVDGNWISQDEVLEELDKVTAAGAKRIKLRINSLGGDAGVAVTIHNRLRELAGKGIATVCVIDGIAASGGSLIACACDEVRVYPASLFMIHKCWSFLFGGYNADELRAIAEQRDAWDRAQINIYSRKTGLSDTVLSHMMSDTTYLAGKEIVDRGFADALEDGDGAQVAASADGRQLLVNGVRLHLAPGMTLPDHIKRVTTAEAEVINQNQPAETGEKGGTKTMARNMEELRQENPELAAQVEADVRAGLGTERDDAVRAAVTREQARLMEIDEIAGLFDADAVQAAKYGEHPCTAQELAYEQARAAASAGRSFAEDYVGAMTADAKAANGVPAAGRKPEDGKEESPEAAAKADYESFRRIKEGRN